MPLGTVMRIEEIIINIEYLAQCLTHGGCSLVSGHEYCNSIIHNLAPTSPPTFHLIILTYPVLQPYLHFAIN